MLGGFRRDAANVLDLDLLVVDEASMVDAALMHQRAGRAAVRVPGAGRRRGPAAVGRAGHGPGRRHRLRGRAGRAADRGLPPGRPELDRPRRPRRAPRRGSQSAPLGQGDFYFVEAEEPATILDRIVTMVRDASPRRFGLDPFRDVQVLTPMNRSELGACAKRPPAGGAESAGRRAGGRALRLEVPRRRQGAANAQ